jgi:hypothetical protein
MQSQCESRLEIEYMIDPVHRPIILSRSGNGRLYCWNSPSAPSHQSSHFIIYPALVRHMITFDLTHRAGTGFLALLKRLSDSAFSFPKRSNAAPSCFNTFLRRTCSNTTIDLYHGPCMNPDLVSLALPQSSKMPSAQINRSCNFLVSSCRSCIASTGRRAYEYFLYKSSEDLPVFPPLEFFTTECIC